MNRIRLLATATLAVALVFVGSPASRAQDPPSGDGTDQPSATQPAARSQPTEDERLRELEKEVSALQQEIAALKQENTPGVKSAALVEPGPGSRAVAPGPAPADDAPPKVTVGSLLGPITLSGEIDGYYAFNFNQPAELGSITAPSGFGGNTLRFFDQNTQQFSLNAVELVADKAPDATSGGFGRAGFHVSTIYGQAAETINGNFNASTPPFNPTDASNIALKEAYIDYIAPIGKGLTFTFGKFVTPAGAEVIESNANWNYSRSILFYYAIPFQHFGINAKYAFNSKWSVTGYLVNNWNDTQQFNTGKTYGVSLAWTPTAKWSVTENYLAGPQDDVALYGALGKPNNNWRELEDATIAFTPNAKWAFQVNGDYDFGDKLSPAEYALLGITSSPAVNWWGVAGYAKYTLNSKSYAAVRYEYFSDPYGAATFTFVPNLRLAEGTFTYAYNWTGAFQTRFEFRDDYSNKNAFEKGTTFAPTQPVVELGFIYTFSTLNAPK
jgi:Putative beta-barrel porin-2, OmpL-like. bbp2